MKLSSQSQYPRINSLTNFYIGIVFVVYWFSLGFATPSVERAQSIVTSEYSGSVIGKLFPNLMNVKESGHIHSYNNNTTTGPITTEQFTSFRSFVIGSGRFDESRPYRNLANMSPDKHDYRPSDYYYGGWFLYPVGVGIFFAEKVGYLSISSDLQFYIKNPDQVANIYKVGRLIVLLTFICTLWVIKRIALLMGDERSGLLSVALFSSCPLVLDNILVTKPHIYAACFVAFAMYFAMLFVRTNRTGFHWMSVIFLGVAVGSSLASGLMLLMWPCLYFGRLQNFLRDGFWIKTCLVVLVVFLIGNPYVLVEPDEFIKTILGMDIGTSGQGYSELSLTTLYWYLISSPFEYGVTIALSLVLTCLLTLRQATSELKRLLLLVLTLFIVSGLTIAAHRITLFNLIPVVVIASLHICFFNKIEASRATRFLYGTSLAAMLVPLIACVLLFNYQHISEKDDYDVVNNEIQNMHESELTPSIGVYETPVPAHYLPYNILTTRYFNLSTDVTVTPDLVLIRNALAERWNNDPRATGYSLVFRSAKQSIPWEVKPLKVLVSPYIQNWRKPSISLYKKNS